MFQQNVFRLFTSLAAIALFCLSGPRALAQQAATPTFSPPAGTFASGQTVTISSTTSGDAIAYTTDGSTPTASGGTVTHGTALVNGGAVAITTTTTLNAIAFEGGFTASAVATATYTIPQAATPTFSPGTGTYIGAPSVTISSTTTGASIAYTTDGSTPTESGGVVTNGTLLSNGGAVAVVTNGDTLKAIAFETGFTDSIANSATYNFGQRAASPNFSPAAGSYASAQTVTISSNTTGASIFYTVNGSTPTESGGSPTNGTFLYSGPVTINAGSTTLKAIAFASGFVDSTVTSGLYAIGLTQVAAPTFSPGAGTYTTAPTVTISSTTSGASIAFTTDGSTPTESGGAVTHGTLYTSNTGPVNITTNATSATITLNAIAFASGDADSAVTSAAYVLTLPQAVAPAFTPASGNYPTGQLITMSSTTPGASIAYTTDGTTPTESGDSVTHGTLLANSGSITLNSPITLNAIAFANGFSDSAMASSPYTITQAGTPSFSPGAGTYGSAQPVTISSATSGALIAYTTDGSTPTESGGTVSHGTALVNGGTVTISGTATLNAIAFVAGGAASGTIDSAVASGVYTISISGTTAAPTFSPAPGTYASALSVTMNSATVGAAIRYTTDGVTTPSETVGTLYTGPVRINATTSGPVSTTIKAIAFQGGLTDSSVSSADYTITNNLFTSPACITRDGSNNLYVGDNVNNTIQQITPSGVVTLIAGTTGTAGSLDSNKPGGPLFNAPSGITEGSNGDLYVADTGNSTIRQIVTGGTVTTFAGTAGSTGSQIGTNATFDGPVGIASDTSGNLYVADTTSNLIRKITEGGYVTNFFTGTAGAYGVAVDSITGNVYVADTGNNTILKISPAGVAATIVSTGLNLPKGLALDSFGNIYVANTGGNTICEFTPTGSLVTTLGSGASGFADGTGTAASFNSPDDLTLDSAGNIFVADTGNAAIRKIAPTGIVTTVALTVPGTNISSGSTFTPTPTAAATSSGGGGAFDDWFLGFLALAGFLRWRNRKS
jgi:sugar lactone lactonase YvrE